MAQMNQSVMLTPNTSKLQSREEPGPHFKSMLQEGNDTTSGSSLANDKKMMEKVNSHKEKMKDSQTDGNTLQVPGFAPKVSTQATLQVPGVSRLMEKKITKAKRFINANTTANEKASEEKLGGKNSSYKNEVPLRDKQKKIERSRSPKVKVYEESIQSMKHQSINSNITKIKKKLTGTVVKTTAGYNSIQNHEK